jgi:hypothetical protein
VDGGMILFFPADGAFKPDEAHAPIQDGKYSLEVGKGPKPGTYRVEITWNKKTGRSIINKSDPPNLIEETLQVIPEQYNTKSTLTRDIKPGINTLDFELKGKKK